MYRECLNFLLTSFLIAILSTSSVAIPSILQVPAACTPELLQKRLVERDQRMCWFVADEKIFRACFFQCDERGRVRLDVMIRGERPCGGVWNRVLVPVYRVGAELIWGFSRFSNPSERPPREVMIKICKDFFGEQNTKTCGPRILLYPHNNAPQLVTVGQAAKRLRGTHVLVYTGAGISAGHVPTMTDIFRSTGLGSLFERPRSHAVVDTCFEHILSDPAPIIEYLERFFYACGHALPTPAHFAITALSRRLHWGVATENIDLLHQRAGLDVVTRGELKSISDQELGLLDYVVTVGLASDESGFLYRCKAVNPRIKFIAFDLAQPSYLSIDDFLVVGDAQVTVPRLSELL